MAARISKYESFKYIAIQMVDMSDERIPNEVVGLFQNETPAHVSVRRKKLSDSGLVLEPDPEKEWPIEFVRDVGQQCIEKYNYAITGARSYDESLEIWFDPVVEGRSDLTVAQRAARILRETKKNSEFEANISGDPKRQYVDVYPNPHEQAGMDFSLHSEEMDKFRDAGLRVRAMHGGRTRSRFNDAEYRIWFEVDE